MYMKFDSVLFFYSIAEDVVGDESSPTTSSAMLVMFINTGCNRACSSIPEEVRHTHAHALFKYTVIQYILIVNSILEQLHLWQPCLSNMLFIPYMIM